MASQALAFEERGEIERLLERIRALPPDSKLVRLTEPSTNCCGTGTGRSWCSRSTPTPWTSYGASCAREAACGCCVSPGAAARSPPRAAGTSGGRIDREQVKRRFRDGDADLLLCTDAAAEGLNFQFCGALVNYDMPWNPMRVEQRIGRIDRVGQRHATIRVVNLHYDGTVETAVYRALRRRIGAVPTGRRTPATDSRADAEGDHRRRARRPGTHQRSECGRPDRTPRLPQKSRAVSTSTLHSTSTSRYANAFLPRSRWTISTA